jgi:hypothetical protein
MPNSHAGDQAPEAETGKTPDEFVAMAKQKGYDAPEAEAGTMAPGWALTPLCRDGVNAGSIGLVSTQPGDRTEGGDTSHDPTVPKPGHPGGPVSRALAAQPRLAGEVVGLAPLPVALLGLGPQAGQPLTQESLIHAAPPEPTSQHSSD